MEELVVGIVEARDLLSEDFNGFSDPFVHLTVLDARGEPMIAAGAFQTRIAKKTLTPKWEQQFTVGSSDFDLRLGTTLRFMIYDFDGLKKNDILGVVDVPIDMITCDKDEPMDDWYRVMKVPGLMTKDATGELHIKFARPSLSSRTVAPPKSPVAAEAGKPNLLYVTIDSGKDLLPMDKNNSSDPFVKLSVVGQRHQTTTIEKTLKPHWDEKFAFLLTDPNNTLELAVEDEDRTVNDFLGRAQIVLADVIEPNVEKEINVTLMDKKFRHDKDRGTLHIRLLWVFDPNAEATAQAKKKKKDRSILQQLKKSMRVAAPDAPYDSDDELNDSDDEIIEDESEDESENAPSKSPPLPPGAEWLKFLVATIHRVEELPPLDSVLFDKGETRKHHSGGIDVYVAAEMSDRPEEYVRTRVRTKQGRRDQLCSNFQESLMLLLKKEKTEENATFRVMDWDPIGGDEMVGQFEIRNVVEEVKKRSNKPFWVNLYGAPVRGCSNTSTAACVMNENSAVASTYRGRVLLTLKIRERSSDAYEAKNQKRLASKLPRESYPPSRVYRMRAHFVSAIGLPLPTAKLSLVMSCGLREISSSRKKTMNGALEWNETEESDKMVFPVDTKQIPDVFVYLCKKRAEKRIALCYKRFTAESLIEQNFEGAPEWVPLIADKALGLVKGNEGFAGNLLLRLGFGTAENSNSHPWDQKMMIEQVNRRMPYQVRVRLYEARNLVVQSGKATEMNMRAVVQCWDQKQRTDEAGKKKFRTVSPLWGETFCFDTYLPVVKYAPQVLFHIVNQHPKEYIGTASISLEDAIVSTAEQIKKNDRPVLPEPKWLPVLLNALDEQNGVVHGQVLASVELIKKTFPDETLPPPEELSPSTTQI